MIAEELERAATGAGEAVRDLSDEDLLLLEEKLRKAATEVREERGTDDTDPVWLALWHLRDFFVLEYNGRVHQTQRLEADLAGGHLVSVGYGNEVDKFAASCDPRPPEPFCWRGPDRDTIEEAVADGRAHHPGHEPAVDEMSEGGEL